MSKINSKRFTVEDFKEQQGWIGRLLAPLNTFINEVIFALNGNVTMENLSQEVKEIRFVNKSVNLPVVFKQRFNKSIIGVQIIYCYDHTNDTVTTISSLPVWTSANGLITVTSIEGLTSNNDYTLRFHVIYE